MSDRALKAGKIRERANAVQPRDRLALGIVGLMLLVFITRALSFNLLGNLQILAIAMATVGIVSIGQTLVVLTGGVDLSVGSLMALTGVITAYLTTTGIGSWIGPINPWIAAALALAAATLVGWLHGVLITRFQLAPFIVTFGSLSLLRGLAQVISNGSPIDLHTDAFDWLWNNAFGVIPVPALVMALLFIAAAFVLRNTRLGRYTYAIGSNETVARLSGVDVGRTRHIIYATSGFLAGIAGLMLLARIEGGTFNSGENYELLSVAAVIIGGTSLKGGTGGVWGTLGGVLVMSLVSNGLVLLSVPPLWKEAITGALIIVAALIDRQRRRIPESTPAPLDSLPALPVEPLMTLDGAVKQLVQTIQEMADGSEIRVYLWDRDAEVLVEPGSRAAPGGSLAPDAYASGRAIHHNNLRRDPQAQVASWRNGASAAAVPIQQRRGVVGVIEMQSAAPNAFSAQMLETVGRLAAQVAPGIEDRWLLESGWLTQQVRECLRNLQDDVFLNHCPLADWLPVNDLIRRSEIARQILCDAMDHTLPETANSSERAARRYQILIQTYTQQIPVDAICQNLSVSRRQYFYDLKDAIDVVVDYLFTQREYLTLRYDSAPVTH